MDEIREARDLEAIASQAPDVRIGLIVTREGRAWSEEAMLSVTDRIAQRFPPDGDAAPGSGILYYAGYLLNDPAVLADILDMRPDAFIILSMPDASAIIPCGQNGLAALVSDALRANPDYSSWEIIEAAWRARGD